MEKIITVEELKEILLQSKEQRLGARPVTIRYFTNPKLLRTDNPFWDKESKTWSLFKIGRINGMVNWSYQRSVNRQREREDKETDFESKPRVWGTRIQGTPLIEHKGNYYIEVKVERNLETLYVDEEGNKVEKSEFAEFIPDRKKSSRQKVDKEIILRDINLENIIEISYNNNKYKIH